MDMTYTSGSDLRKALDQAAAARAGEELPA
jgi:hypothetical protein